MGVLARSASSSPSGKFGECSFEKIIFYFQSADRSMELVDLLLRKLRGSLTIENDSATTQKLVFPFVNAAWGYTVFR
jgi:hypothetical protein